MDNWHFLKLNLVWVHHFWTSLAAQTVKHLPIMRETWIQSLGWGLELEKEMATHSSILTWKIPWTEEPDRLQSMGSQRVRHDWAMSLHTIFRKLLFFFYYFKHIIWIKIVLLIQTQSPENYPNYSQHFQTVLFTCLLHRKSSPATEQFKTNNMSIINNSKLLNEFYIKLI